jgi:hypothetical protein
MCFQSAVSLIKLGALSGPQKAKLKKKLQECKKTLQARMNDVDRAIKVVGKRQKAKRRRA